MITVWFCYTPRDPGQAAGGDHTLSMHFWPGSFFALISKRPQDLFAASPAKNCSDGMWSTA